MIETTLEGAQERAANLAIHWPEAEVHRALQSTNLLEAWLRVRLEQQLQQLAPLERLRHHWFASAATSLFLQRRADLDQVVFSILRLNDAELALELYFRLQAGEADFPQLAHHSHGPERHLAGRLGPLALAQLQPLVANQLRRATPGQLQPPLECDSGEVLLLRLDLLMPATQNATTQQKLEQELYSNWLEDQLQRLLALQPISGQELRITLPGPPP